jgi:hypothetical protein
MPQGYLRTHRPHFVACTFLVAPVDLATAAVRADVKQDVVNAIAAEGALERADAGNRRCGRKVLSQYSQFARSSKAIVFHLTGAFCMFSFS